MAARPPTGIVVRHSSRKCPAHNGGSCKCPGGPAYQAAVYSRAEDRKIRKTFPTLAEARSWRADSSVALRKGELHSPSKAVLRQAGEEWIEKAERGEALAKTRRPYKPSTLRTYKHDLATYVYPDLGALRIGDVRRRDLRAFVDRLIGDGLSGSKVRNVIVAVQALYRHAKARDLVTVDPTDGLQLPEPSAPRDRAASPTEAARLLAALPEAERPLWATAFYAGLRRGELRALHADNIIGLGAQVGTVKIHVAAGWDDVEGEIEPKSKKGERDVPVADTLRAILAAHRLRTGRTGTDLVFGRTASEPFTPSHVRKQAGKAWKAAKLNPMGLHEARHTYVSMMHAAGLSLERIGDYVGHSSTYMTDRYRHLLEGHEAEAAAQFDAYLTGAQSGAQGTLTGMVTR
jgi:integrase